PRERLGWLLGRASGAAAGPSGTPWTKPERLGPRRPPAAAQRTRDPHRSRAPKMAGLVFSPRVAGPASAENRAADRRETATDDPRSGAESRAARREASGARPSAVARDPAIRTRARPREGDPTRRDGSGSDAGARSTSDTTRARRSRPAQAR